jgi:hypothetical protein
MAEDSWLRCEREYFAETEASVLDIPVKKLSKALEKYNKFLQAALFGESPFVAEDLRLTILKAGGNVDSKQ